LWLIVFGSVFKGLPKETHVREMRPGYAGEIRVAHNEKEYQKSTYIKSELSQTNDEARRKKRQSRMESKAAKKQTAEEEERAKMKEAFFLCDAKYPLTSRYCRNHFLTEQGLRSHQSKDKHYFQTGVSARNLLLYKARNAGGSLAVGSIPDRSSKVCFYKVILAIDNSPGEALARCKGGFHRKETQGGGFRKPPKLIHTLETMFQIKPKLDEFAFFERMAEMKDCSPMFCAEKADTNGKLLEKNVIKQWITKRTRSRG
jgi:hypothetical protein